MSAGVQATVVPGPAGAIEVRWQAPEREAPEDAPASPPALVAIIAHPHPLYGGAMDNKVVTTLARLYRRLGAVAVRFNFRGVGGSAGVHDEGRGEVDDLLAVARWTKQQWPDAALLLAGYSFGSAIAAAASEQLEARHLALIAPPVERYPYAPRGDFACPTTVVLGSADELVDADAVAAWAATRAAVGRVILLPAASHFFHGELVALERELAPAVAAALDGVGAPPPVS
ncbi:MAG TPA: hypothetical protein VFV18_00915 [Porticoccaceae bacterium]|nr:hypothetical protein [Porticoccaceae bacterium]